METCISDTYVCYSLCTEHGDTLHTWRSFFFYVLFAQVSSTISMHFPGDTAGVYDSWQISLSFFSFFLLNINIRNFINTSLRWLFIYRIYSSLYNSKDEFLLSLFHFYLPISSTFEFQYTFPRR